MRIAIICSRRLQFFFNTTFGRLGNSRNGRITYEKNWATRITTFRARPVKEREVRSRRTGGVIRHHVPVRRAVKRCSRRYGRADWCRGRRDVANAPLFVVCSMTSVRPSYLSSVHLRPWPSPVVQ